MSIAVFLVELFLPNRPRLMLDLQKPVKSKGVKFDIEVDESSEGPARFVILDPDGNPVLVVQHV